MSEELEEGSPSKWAEEAKELWLKARFYDLVSFLKKREKHESFSETMTVEQQAELLGLLSNGYYCMDSLRDAEEAAKKALAKDSKCLLALCTIAQVRALDMVAIEGSGNVPRDLQEALDVFETREDHEDPVVATVGCILYEFLGTSESLEKAVNLVTKVLEKMDDLSFVYVARGNAVDASGDATKAMNDFTRAIELNPYNWIALNNRASLRSSSVLQEHALAVDDCTQALRINPHYSLAYISRGYAHRFMRKYEEAAKDFSAAIKLNPADAVAYNNRAHVYLDMRRYDEAIIDYEMALRLNPKDAMVAMFLDYAHVQKREHARIREMDKEKEVKEEKEEKEVKQEKEGREKEEEPRPDVVEDMF
eukprot:TRINITY_DN1902_c0_g1_i1.p2 TRINITY_DN1902_c0_g1~~TRINITY_DN1902_c0_g1_i1.p2  ORF type:complete len:364 (-),score=135.69 TRINITY_DN1902_c0_g1_i1:1660-2751(-)